MKMRILFFLCTLFVLQGFTQKATAQSLQVTGKVMSKSNEPLPGATVTVKGSTVSKLTDAQGFFSINVPDRNAVLVVTYLGYDSQELPVKNSSSVVFNLSENIRGLDEVVVVGYGTQKKSVVTGAISSVKAKDLENVPNGRIEQALQGRVAGVTIM